MRLATIGTRMFNIWCEYHWETYVFFNGSLLLDLQSSEPSDELALEFFYVTNFLLLHYFTSVHAEKIKDHHKKHKWVIVVAVVVIVVILAAIISG